MRWGLNHAGRKVHQHDRIFPLGYERVELDNDAAAKECQELLNLGVRKNGLKCTFIGRFERMYDLATIIRAARKMAQAGRKDIQFVLCGDGSQRSELEHLSRGLDNVVFTGWCSRNSIAALMELSDVGIISLIQGSLASLPNKPFEYFAGGLPVLSNLSGELAEILAREKAGLTFMAGDVGGLVDAIKRLADNFDLRIEMSQRAKALYESQFDARQVYSNMSGYLELIADENR